MLPRVALPAVLLALLAAAPAHAAYPTAVNTQITDAVTQANVEVLGAAPAIAMGNLFTATADALEGAASGPSSGDDDVTMSASATMRPLTECSAYLTATLLATCLADG